MLHAKSGRAAVIEKVLHDVDNNDLRRAEEEDHLSAGIHNDDNDEEASSFGGSGRTKLVELLGRNGAGLNAMEGMLSHAACPSGNLDLMEALLDHVCRGGDGKPIYLFFFRLFFGGISRI